MKSESQKLLYDAIRNDFKCFLERSFQTLNSENQLLWSDHIEAMAYYLEETRHGRSTRLIIKTPMPLAPPTLPDLR